MSNKPAAKILSEELNYKRYRTVKTYHIQPKSIASDEYREAFDWEVYLMGNAVVVLLYNPDTDQILLNRQFRVGAFIAGEENPYMLECCGGAIEEGQTPEEAVTKEVLEETGTQVLDLELINKTYPSYSCTTESLTLYCARIKDTKEGIFGTEIEEETQTKLYDAKDAIKMADNGEILNTATLLCLNWFARNHERLKAKWG